MDTKDGASTMRRPGIVGALAALMALVLLFAPIRVGANHKSGMINETSDGTVGANELPYRPNRVLVSFKAVAYSAVGEEADLGIRPLVRFRGADGVSSIMSTKASGKANDLDSKALRSIVQSYEISDGMSVEAKVAQLSARNDVALAEPDYLVQLYRGSTDPLLSSQWHQTVMRSSAAWDHETGSSDVKVCVIDSGVNNMHPDLAGNIVKGWNVAPDVNNQYAPPGSDQWSNFNDTLGHGTHVTGLIAAVGNNRKGVAGVAWKAGVLSCRFISDSGSGYISDAITCMRLCQEEGAHIYSSSWGGVGHSEMLLEEIQKLDAAGALFVVAAGNNNLLNLDSTPLYPASYKIPNVLTVASTTSSDRLSAFSNIGPGTVHVAAPGSTIYSTTVDGGYGTMSGTSMAAPIVSGLAALLKSVALRANYTMTAHQLKDIITESAVPFTNGNMYTTSGGRVDALAAVRLLESRIREERQPKQELGQLGDMVKNNDPDDCTSPGAPVVLSTHQSSTYKNYVASNALDKDTGYNARKNPRACSMTSPKRSHAWWTTVISPDNSSKNVTRVSITSRGDCCWKGLKGAKVMIGDSPWTGSGSAKRFKTCGVIGSDGAVVRGGKGVNEIVCHDGGISGKHLAVYLPKKRRSLRLCGVEWTTMETT